MYNTTGFYLLDIIFIEHLTIYILLKILLPPPRW